MRTGRTMRALKQTATDRGIKFSNMIKPGHVCGGSHFSRTIILSEYRFRWSGFHLLVPFIIIPLTLGNLALLNFYQLLVSLVSSSRDLAQGRQQMIDTLVLFPLQVDLLKSSVEAFQKHVCACRRSFAEIRPPFSRPGGGLLLEVRGHLWADAFQPCKEPLQGSSKCVSSGLILKIF